jgi:KDO2-lipid IV(A) lauroyltransferase
MASNLLLPKRLARAFPRLQRFASWLEYAVLRALVGLLRALPPPAAFAFARAVLRALGPLTPMWDKVARNHRIAFAGLDLAARRRLRRETFASLGSAVAELVLAPRLWAEREERFEWSIDPAVSDPRGGKPMVLVTGHVGAWQLTNLVAAQHGFALTSLYAEESNPGFAELMRELRDGLRCTWLPSAGGVKVLLEELRAGHSVGLACDTRLDQGEAVPFFAHPVMSNTIPARLALRLGCELVPVRAERLPGQRFRIHMDTPIRPADPTAPQAAQALEMTAQLMARFEGWVRQTPAEWMCLARRFPKELDKAARSD